MFFALDEFGMNLRIGGYLRSDSAVTAVLKAGPNGTVINDRRELVKVVKNGAIWQPHEFKEFLERAEERGRAYALTYTTINKRNKAAC